MAFEEVFKKKVDKRTLVVVGELPDDFLRINIPRVNENVPSFFDALSDRRIDQYLKKSIRLSITIAQAQLAKNYGLTRMDPYCKLNIGGVTFQTITAVNGAKNPVWNRIIILLLAPEINEFDLEIYDEKSFTPDTRFAWAKVRIPERVYHGDDQNHWFPLSGLSGVDVEGQINLLFTLLSPPSDALKLKAPFLLHSPTQKLPPPRNTQPPNNQPSNLQQSPIQPSNNQPNNNQPNNNPPINNQPIDPTQIVLGPATQQQSKLPNAPGNEQYLMDERIDGEEEEEEDDEEETKRKAGILKDMFKDTQDDVILLVLESNSGNIDASVNALLAMQGT